MKAEELGKVTLKLSKQRPVDGGWTTLEICLPAGSPDEDIDDALDQWERMESKAMQRLSSAVLWYGRSNRT